MAIAVQLEFHGATLDQYDRIIEMIGLLPGGPTFPHELFHWATKTDDGFRSVSVWETREAFESFELQKLSPIYPQVGVQLPEIRFFEVHNFLPGGRFRGVAPSRAIERCRE